MNIRDYKNKDKNKCSELCVEAWKNVLDIVIDRKDVYKFYNAYIDTSLISSTWKKVILIENEVIGFLFGSVKNDFSFIKKIISIFKFIKLIVFYIAGKYGRMKKPYSILDFIKNYFQTMQKVEKECKEFDGCIELFVVSSKHRGKGIGRKLINDFIQYSKSKKTKTIYLFTDEDSNWKFYEIYGFKRHFTFEDYHLSYIKQKSMNSFIYTIDL